MFSRKCWSSIISTRIFFADFPKTPYRYMVGEANVRTPPHPEICKSWGPVLRCGRWDRGPLAIITFFSSILFQARFARQLLCTALFYIINSHFLKFNGIRALAYLTLRMSFHVIYSKHSSLYDKRHYMQHVILIFFFGNNVDVVQRHATSLTLNFYHFLSTRV